MFYSDFVSRRVEYFHRFRDRSARRVIGSPPLKIIPPFPRHEEEFGHGPISMNFSTGTVAVNNRSGAVFQTDGPQLSSPDFKINDTIRDSGIVRNLSPINHRPYFPILANYQAADCRAIINGFYPVG